MKDIPAPYAEHGSFCPGHAACGGCAEALSMRVILNEIGEDAVGVVAPSCTAIILGGYPASSARIPVIHGLIETAAAMATGVRRGLNAQGKSETKVICFAGDGGTYDIGLQALSSAAERNEDILYICFDNEGYMNTGGQKSSSTPLSAATGSTPLGKTTPKKNLVEIMAAHRVPYIATASPSDLPDLAAKMRRARDMHGFRMLIVLIPCLPGWGVADDSAVRVARMAVEAGVFPLLEVSGGTHWKLSHPDRTRPVADYLAAQKRYRHLDAEAQDALEAEVAAGWARIKALESINPEE